MIKEKLVLIGNGMAGVRALEELLEMAPDMYDITIFGDEPCGNYNRIMLSQVLAGKKDIDEIMLNKEDWYKDKGITLFTDSKVIRIDRKQRCVTAADGTEASYDRLLLATGSNPILIPVPGTNLPGVVTFRNIHDVECMLEASHSYNQAVVIGGGLLGLETANGLLKQGMDVTVIHLADNLMDYQLDAPAAALLKRFLEERGLSFEMASCTKAILGSERVTAVQLSDDREIPADLVVIATGIRPNIELAKNSGLHCEQGIVVNDSLQTFDPRIYAVGECVQHRGQSYGLVAPLFDQAKVAANHLARLGFMRYTGSITSTKLKVNGIDLFSAGDFSDDENSEEIVLQDTTRGVYKKIVINNNRIKGVVMYGDTLDGSWYFQMMRDGIEVTNMREQLLFGQAHLGDSGHDGIMQVTDMADNTEICGCNGVTKGDIVNSISEKGLFTLDEVRAYTKASASCGSCTGLVESLLASTVGEGYEQTPYKKALCGCTTYTHDGVRQAIREHHLKTIPAAMHFMEWNSTDGCNHCRPALNYYLLCAWPGEYQDDPRSRHINERVHANIQKDGSFAVIPRFWGGLTSADQLRAMADVADKYKIPAIKITGGQRIALAGIAKETLPRVWRDLNEAGFVSGHAYGKALRSVKTCVGDLLCSYGIRDSIPLGIELEKMAWGSWTPNKLKVGVSGCPRNCAEATIKDLGLVAVESGWEIHVGGNGGAKVRIADFMIRVPTSEEAMEYCAAFIQLYREEGHYAERTAQWIERMGLSYVKKRLLENEQERKALAERFHYSQQFAQVDPWKEHVEREDQREYTPIVELAS
ncbi:MAG: nitrite reductase large subunit [bacterium]|nr:MAG: nitrite reductase large subunit [bacterium]